MIARKLRKTKCCKTKKKLKNNESLFSSEKKWKLWKKYLIKLLIPSQLSTLPPSFNLNPFHLVFCFHFNHKFKQKRKFSPENLNKNALNEVSLFFINLPSSLFVFSSRISLSYVNLFHRNEIIKRLSLAKRQTHLFMMACR